MNRRYRYAGLFLGIGSLAILIACTANNAPQMDVSEVASATGERLCRALNGRPAPALSLRRAIDHELERRGKRCFGKVVINRPPDPEPSGGSVVQAEPPDDATPPVAKSPKKKDDAAPEIKGTGTAFAVNRHGNLLTNHHVVNGCDTTWIASGGKLYPALIVATDSVNDLAVISVPGLPVGKTARFRSDGPELGEDLMVAGFPYASMLGANMKTTFGNVSSSVGINNNASEFQLTAPVQPGNSGGPIVGQSGAVIGIVTARLNDEYMLKSRGEIGQLINFGVKSDIAALFLRSHRVPIETISASKKMSNSQLAAEALGYTFLLVCA